MYDSAFLRDDAKHRARGNAEFDTEGGQLDAKHRYDGASFGIGVNGAFHTRAGKQTDHGRVKVTPVGIFGEYYNLRTFNENFCEGGLVARVEQNENFFIGEQWKGVNAPNLDKPVLNILKRVVSYQNANLVSDDIGVNVTGFEGEADEKAVTEMLANEFERVMEQTDFKRKNRDVVRNASVDGDACMHFYWEQGEATGDVDPLTGELKFAQGNIAAEMKDNTDVYFGNPQVCEVEKQPYILLSFRRLVDEVRDTAGERGGCGDDVTPDEGEDAYNKPSEENKVTVLRKYWRERGQIWYTDVTAGAVVVPPTETGLRRYPLAWLCWEKVKNSYHGQASITGMIPNQIFINKLLAMSMQHVKMMAFPTILYNSALIRGGWNNRVGASIGVRGDPNMAVATSFKAQDMSAQVLLLIDKVIQYTRDTMGASDASLGNVKPDNTSAIIATQQATSLPLELQKMDYYAFVEDCVRIWLDMMAEHYGERTVMMRPAVQEQGMGEMSLPAQAMADTAHSAPWGYGFGNGETEGDAAAQWRSETNAIYGGLNPMHNTAGAGLLQMPAGLTGTPQIQQAPQEAKKIPVLFDFSLLRDANLRLKVDIGAATYWSEMQQVRSLDGLVANGILQDSVTYLENMPDGYIPNKQNIIDSIKRKQEQDAQMQQMAQFAAMQNAQTGAMSGVGTGEVMA